MNTIVNPDPANGTTAPNVGISAARRKPRGKHVALAAALLASGGLLVAGLGLAAGTADAAPGPATQQHQISDGKIITPIPQCGLFPGPCFGPPHPHFFGPPPFVPIFVPPPPPGPPPPPPPLPDWAPAGTQVVWDATQAAWGVWLNGDFIVL